MRDFIPDGDIDGEPIGSGGFQDFVPEPQPRPVVVDDEPEANKPVKGSRNRKRKAKK